MKHKIIAGITTKNEDWIIEKTLNSLVNYCDKIIIYDDGSTDHTEKICRSFDSVEWYLRPPHDPLKREEALQRKELIDILKKWSPDYALLLDADEIPTPSIVPFLQNMDEDINLWQSRMINLWNSEKHYRIDSYVTPMGVNQSWDPFSKNAWKKHVLLKMDQKINYEYDLSVQKGGCSRYHPSPGNVPDPVKFQEQFYIIHYGKLSPTYINNEKLKYYASIETADGKGNYSDRFRHHLQCKEGGIPRIVNCPSEWFW